MQAAGDGLLRFRYALLVEQHLLHHLELPPRGLAHQEVVALVLGQAHVQGGGGLDLQGQHRGEHEHDEHDEQGDAAFGIAAGGEGVERGVLHDVDLGFGQVRRQRQLAHDVEQLRLVRIGHLACA